MSEPLQITMVNVERVKLLPIADAQLLIKELEYRNTLISTFIEYGQVLKVSAKEEEVVRLNMELQQNIELQRALMLKVQQYALALKKSLILGFDAPEQEGGDEGAN